jgi:serine/threonine protein kinase
MSGTQLLRGSSLVGRVLAGRYTVRSLLGRGGMGEVYEAHDDVLNRDVAVKILPGVASEDRRSLARLRREARAAAGLNHPNCVAVHDLVVADGRAFIVMELVPGRSLSRILDDGTPLLPAVALRIARDAAEALAYAHARGVTHRDIAPGNVIVRPDGRAKVLDFGLARAEDWTPAIEGGPSPRGTVAYLSPEQVHGRHGDARSDVYSLGCVLYEMLTGRPPFEGPSPAAVATQHVRAVPVPPSVLRPEISWDIERVVLRCLSKEPRGRFADASELIAALDDLGRSPSEAATHPLRRDVDPWPTPSIEGGEVTVAVPPAPSRRRRWPAAVAAAIAVLLSFIVLPTARLLVAPPAELSPSSAPRPLFAPTGVVAEGVCNGFLRSRVDVAWVPAAFADGYEVYRSTSPTGGFAFVARVSGGDETSYHDVDLGMGQTYYYVVKSVSGPRLSAATDSIAAETPLFCLG